MPSKIEINRLRDAGIAKEIFTHVTLGSFDVTETRAMIRSVKSPTVRCEFADMRVEDSSLDALTHLFNNREIDRTRAAALNFVEIDEPVIILDCPPGANGIGATQLLIDGIHRIFERHRRGYSFFEAYLLPLQLACRADLSEGRFAPWGKFDVVPGRGLVRRKDK